MKVKKNLKLVGKSTFLIRFLRNSSFLVPMKVKNTIQTWVKGITPFQVVNNYCIRMQFQSSHQGSHMIRQNVCTGCLNNKSQFLTKCISGHSGWKCSNSFFLSSQGLYIYGGVNFFYHDPAASIIAVQIRFIEN